MLLRPMQLASRIFCDLRHGLRLLGIGPANQQLGKQAVRLGLLVSRGPSDGDVGIVTFCLQHRDGGAHGSDDDDSRLSVRKHVPHDVFR